jgi:hypothetical protein
LRDASNLVRGKLAGRAQQTGVTRVTLSHTHACFGLRGRPCTIDILLWTQKSGDHCSEKTNDGMHGMEADEQHY